MDNQIFNNYFSYILLSVIASIAVAPMVIKFLYRFKITRNIEVDFSTIIESRKDKLGTPIMGGLIVIFPVILLNMLFNLSNSTLVLVLIFFLTAVIGGFDDILNIYGKKRRNRSVKRIIKLIKVHKYMLVRIKYFILLPWYIYKSFINMFESNPGKGLMGHEKFFLQILVGGILGTWIYIKYGGFLWLPFVSGIDLGILIIPFVIFSLLGMTNAVNFTDGLDGLSSGLLLIAFLGFTMLSGITMVEEVGILTSTVVGALITYMYFNIPPARVQFGDVGSFSLGALLTAVAFALQRSMLLPIIGFPFVVEVVSTIIQSVSRRIFGRRIFRMAPIHHHFEMKGWSEEKVVMRFWLFGILCVFIGLWVNGF